MANAINGQNPSTNLLKLARVCQKAQPDMDADILSAAWMKHAATTCQWALSTDAGDLQLCEMSDVPEPWRKAVAATKDAFEIGVDMTKVNSYSNMVKISNMLTKQAEKADAEQTEEEDDEVPILEEEDVEETEQEEEASPDTEEEESEEAEEPEQEEHELEPEPKADKPKKPRPTEVDTDTKLSNEDAQFAAAVVDAALKSGQVLDPDKIVMCPVGLIQAAKWLDELTDGKRLQLEKGMTNLVKAQYENHLEELAEGKKRASGNKSAQQKKARADALAKKAANDEKKVITLADTKKGKAKETKAPPKRSAKEESAEFSDQFAAMIDG